MTGSLLIIAFAIFGVIFLATGLTVLIANNRKAKAPPASRKQLIDSTIASSLPGYFDNLDAPTPTQDAVPAQLREQTGMTAQQRALRNLGKYGSRFGRATGRIRKQFRQFGTNTTRGLRQNTGLMRGMRRSSSKNTNATTGIFVIDSNDNDAPNDVGIQTGRIASESGFDIPQNLADYGTQVVYPPDYDWVLGGRIREGIAPPSTSVPRPMPDMYIDFEGDDDQADHSSFYFESRDQRRYTAPRNLSDIYDNTLVFGAAPPANPDFDLESSPRPYFSVVTGLREDGPANLKAWSVTENGRMFSNGDVTRARPRVVGAPGEFVNEPTPPTSQASPLVAATAAEATQPEIIPFYDPTTYTMGAFFRRPKGERKSVFSYLRTHPFAPFMRIFRGRSRRSAVIVTLASVFMYFLIISGVLLLGRQTDRAEAGEYSIIYGRLGLTGNFDAFEDNFRITNALVDSFRKQVKVVDPAIRVLGSVISNQAQAQSEIDRTRSDIAIWGFLDNNTNLLNLNFLLQSTGPFDPGQVGRREMAQHFYESANIRFITPVPDPNAPSQFSDLLTAIFAYYSGDYDLTIANLNSILNNTPPDSPVSSNRLDLLFMLANTYYLIGNYDAAIRNYNTCLELIRLRARQDDIPTFWVDNNRAIALLQRNASQFFPEVLNTVNRILGQNQKQTTLLLNYAYLLIDRARTEPSAVTLVDLQNSLINNANLQNPYVQYYLGYISNKQENWRNARTSAERAIQLENGFAPAYNLLGTVYLREFLSRPVEYGGRGNAKGYDILAKARQALQSGYDIASSQRMALLDAGNRYRQEVRNDLVQSSEIRVRTVVAHANELEFNLARVVLEQGKLEGNIVGNFLDRFMRFVQNKTTFLEDAEKRFREIIAKRGDAENGEGYFYLGESLFYLDRFEEANQAYNEAKRRNPNNLMFYQIPAYRAAANNNPNEAFAQLDVYRNRNANDPKLFVAYGRVNLTLKRYDQALSSAGQAIRLDPNDPAAHLLAAEANVARRDFNNAVNNLQAADRLRPRDPDIAFTRGLAYYSIGNAQEAYRFFEQAIEFAGGDYPQANLYLGIINQDVLGNTDEALKELLNTVRRKDDTPDAWYRIGLIYSQRDQIPEAINAYEKAIFYQPNNYVPVYNAGLLYELRGNLDLAEQRFRRALELQPGLVNGYFKLGELVARKGQIDEGLRLVGVSARLDPSNPEVEVAYGNIWQARGNFQQAIQAYNRAIQLRNNFGEAYYRRSKAYLALNNSENALRDINRALEIDPDNGDYFYQQGLIYASRRQFNEAVSSYRQSLAFRPTNPNQVALQLGVAQIELRDYRNAEATFNQILRSDSNFAEARFQLANLYLLTGQLQRASEQYQTVLRAQPNFGLGWFYLGRSYILQGRTEDAINAYNNAINNGINRPEVFFELGNTFRAKDQLGLAVQQYDEALKRDQNFFPAYLQKGLVLEQQGQVAPAREAFQAALRSPDPFIQRQANDALNRLPR
jgi:tetratricopeptide (TPR) repeat protein